MPVIKIEKVVSFSSEDPVHVANNILSNDPAKKWKCRSQGEKSASIVLQLEKACVISSIDIGNESSAYIEVLVNRSSTHDDFKVLLVMSSFMSPMEARQGLNLNKVRMFNKDQLSKPEYEEKWDRIKIVCTQPFNRHVQYGLSFITFHSSGEKEASATPTITKFIIRPDSPDNLTAGSLFARRKELQENTTLKAAAAIREATSLALESKKIPSSQKKLKFYAMSSSEEIEENENTMITERNRNDLLYTKDEEEPNKKIDYIVEQKNKEKNEKQKKTETPKKREKKEKEVNTKAKQKVVSPRSKTTTKPSTSTSETSKRKLAKSDTPNKKLKLSKLYKPFNQLLEDVIFVISGIQNPDRANLRAKAMSMGAKYKSDWDNSSTHLICAFPNTPKFNQVKGKGKIVTKNWINDCESKRKRLPWRRYALDKSDKAKIESEDEICELTQQENKVNISESPASTSKNEGNFNNTKNNAVLKQSPETHKGQGESDVALDDMGSPLQKTNGTKKIDIKHDDSQDLKNSGTDTEDEIERIQKLQKKPVKKLSDIFNVDTDEEEIARICGKNGNPSLPEFFTDKTFYIDPHLSNKDKALLVKYITAFNGTIKENLNGSIDIVISSMEHKSALSSSSNAVILSSDFIWECHNCQTLIPVDKFKL